VRFGVDRFALPVIWAEEQAQSRVPVFVPIVDGGCEGKRRRGQVEADLLAGFAAYRAGDVLTVFEFAGGSLGFAPLSVREPPGDHDGE